MKLITPMCFGNAKGADKASSMAFKNSLTGDLNDFQVLIREHLQNSSDAFLQKRFFPNNRDQQDNPDHRLTHEQLLPLLIAYFAPDASNKALLETAHAMLPITAMITAIAIICLFGTAGFWWEGAIAALGGGLSFSYLSRSAVGRIDTDQLNLAFFYTVTALVLLAARVKGWRAALLASFIAGSINWLFSWWYTKDILSWFFLGVLVYFGDAGLYLLWL